MSDSKNARFHLVSLQSLFPQAVIASGDDILVRSCSRRISPRTSVARDGHHVYVAGTDAGRSADCDAINAVENGATAILTERLLPISTPQCIVADVAASHAILTHELHGKPSTKILTIGVIGSHGKTTAALYAASMLKRLTGKIAYWTTLGATDHGTKATKKDETNAQTLTAWLARAVKDNCPAAVIEISDSMLQSKTASALEFDVILCPGLRENQRYGKLTTKFIENALLKCCQQLKKHGLVVYNADDARLNRWIERNNLPGLSYALDAESSVCGNQLRTNDGEQQLMVSAGRALMPMQVSKSKYITRHMLGAVAVGYAFGLELNEIIGGVEQLKRIPGRMQAVGNGELVQVTIDRADQADRLAVAMHDAAHDGRRIIAVAEVPEVSTPEQRAAYGKVLSRTASRVILTQSRASLTLGQKLTWEVIDGCDRPAEIEIVPNRRAAIELAIRESNYGDHVMLVGMGSEAWMPPREKAALRDEDVAKSALQSIVTERQKSRPLPNSRVAMPLSNLRVFNGS